MLRSVESVRAARWKTEWNCLGRQIFILFLSVFESNLR